MRSLEEMKVLIKKSVADAKAQENALRVNPALAHAPEVKRQYRINGVVMFVLGLGVCFATYMGYQETGRVLNIALAAIFVLTPGGIWMMIRGTNPFANFKK